MHVNSRQTDLSAIRDISFDPIWAKAYEAHYVQIDIRLEYTRRLLERHPVMTDDILCSYCDYRNSEFYREYSLPQKRAHFMGFGGIRSRDGWFTTLAVQRTAAQGTFGADEMALHHHIKPHIERALQIHDRFGRLSERGQEIEAVLDHVSTGVMLIDKSGRLLHTNAYAEQVLADGDGLASWRGSLQAISAADSRRLEGLIANVLAGGSGGALAIARKSGLRSLNVLVAPLRHIAEFARATESKVVVFLSDPERHPEFPMDTLRRLYEFTPAEGRIAAELVKGRSVKNIAAAFEITEETVRKALKSMFQKTGTSRQGELVALLLSSIPQI
jgi:DNA-binding CsgD family transcriptional regulator